MQTLIIIPCYNEASRLETKTFLAFSAKHPHIHLLFVNDGSSDNTKIMLDAMTAITPETISALHLGQNKGKAEAVRLGFIQGFLRNPDVIGFLDADLAAPLESILELETALAIGNKDIVFAARVALLGRDIQRSAIRHYAGRCFATVVSILLKLAVYDTQCGAKLFRVTDRLKSVFAAPFTTKWIFDVEILARFIITENAGQPPVRHICIEYPLHQWNDKKGSKLHLKDFIVSGMDLFKILLLMRRKILPT